MLTVKKYKGVTIYSKLVVGMKFIGAAIVTLLLLILLLVTVAVTVVEKISRLGHRLLKRKGKQSV